MRQHGIGRGEAAAIALVRRDQAVGVFVSSDQPACRVARKLGLAYLTLIQVLEMWIDSAVPATDDLNALVEGMRGARFGLTEDTMREQKARLRP